jgi:WD40 repeat protein/tRNA A-37 threonylcarbamoyl transferase component Bud32
MAFEIGDTIHHYCLKELLGQGGMSSVYLAYDTHLEREVAVKIIREDIFGSAVIDDLRKRFEREAKALARLTHANIVPVIDYGEFEGIPYLVMPYLPGGSLKTKLTGNPINWHDALTLLLPIAKALGYAHKQGILHRDVKPGNILFTASDDPMLGDFGIAKMLLNTEAVTLTGTGVSIGTPEYMSPEQGLGQKIDSRSDLYSLGIVLYEMITGKRPFEADTPMAVIFKHVSAPLPSPSQFTPTLPKPVETVITKALEKNTKDRYKDMAEFATALQGLMGRDTPIPEVQPQPFRKNQDEVATVTAEVDYQEIVTEEPTPKSAAAEKPLVEETLVDEPLAEVTVVDEPIAEVTVVDESLPDATIVEEPFAQETIVDEKQFHVEEKTISHPRIQVAPSKRKIPWWSVGIAIIVLFCVLLTFGVVLRRIANKENFPLLAKWKNATATVTSAISSPLLTHEEEASSTDQIYINQDNAIQVVEQFRWGKGTIQDAAFSPDGLKLAIASSLGIYLYDAQSLAEQLFLETNSKVTSLAFSPDGTHILGGCHSGTAILWDLSDPSQPYTLAEGLSWINSVAYSPDGNLLAVASRDGTIRIWQAVDLAIRYILSGNFDQVNSIAFSSDSQRLAIGTNDPTVRMWEKAEQGQAISRLGDHQSSVTHVTYDSNSKAENNLLASTSLDGTINIWQAGVKKISIDSQQGEIYSAAFSPDNTYLISAAANGTAALWEVESGSFKCQEKIDSSPVIKAIFSPDGNQVVFLLLNGKLEIWSFTRKSNTNLQLAKSGAIDGFNGQISSIAFSPDSQYLAIGSTEAGFEIKRMEDNTRAFFSDGKSEGVTCLKFMQDNQHLIIGSSSGEIRIVDITSGARTRSFIANTYPITSLDVGKDDTIIASASQDGSVNIYYDETGKEKSTYKYLGTAIKLAISPTAAYLVIGYQTNLTVLNYLDKSFYSKWGESSDEIASLSISPDSSLIGIGAENGKINLWLLSENKLLRVLQGHSAEVSSIAFSPDSSLLASASGDNTIKIWRVSDGKLLTTLSGHTYAVTQVAFSPDGKLIASGSLDGTVRLWGLP